MFRVVKGALVPADQYTVRKLRERNYHAGDLVQVVIKKLNNPKFHGLIHRIGQLCAKNIEQFEGWDAHKVLKRLQWEANIYCEEVPVYVDGGMVAVMRFPQSMSFDAMDDGARHVLARGLCAWIAKRYWPKLSADQVEEMAESFVEEV